MGCDPSELEILKELLPGVAKDKLEKICTGQIKLAIFVQTSHLDYDWLTTFYHYLRYGVTIDSGSVQSIIEGAARLMDAEPPPAPPSSPFAFSIAEVAFLKAAIANCPKIKTSFEKAGNRFCLIGGALETPDSILPPSEVFIRCYLQGLLWASQTFPKVNPLSCAWLPDNFGFCSSLPILFAAMGIPAVGLSRLPGSVQQDPENGTLAAALFKDKAIDFRWTSVDRSSSVIVHWMQNKYNQDLPIEKLEDVREVLFGKGEDKWNGNAEVSPTQYCLVPLGDDFGCPNASLARVIGEWNAKLPVATQMIAAGTVAQYMALVSYHVTKINEFDLRTHPPTPYWTGFYATRPAIKRLLRQGTVALLGAETFAAIAMLAPNVFGTGALPTAIEDAWASLSIGASHNILTGCGTDPVSFSEQIPFLEMSSGTGETIRSALVKILAQATWGDGYSTGEIPIVVLQQVGLPVEKGLVEYRADPALDLNLKKVRSLQPAGVPPPPRVPVQLSAEGSLLLKADAPSMGYQRATLSEKPPSEWFGPLVFGTLPNNGCFLENELLRAEIDEDGDVAKLTDKKAKRELFVAHGNQLIFYRDTGDIYRFGNEKPFDSEHGTWSFHPLDKPIVGKQRAVLEVGPIRIRVSCTTTYKIVDPLYPTVECTYTREYQLVADEPYLRMITRGAAPKETSVFVAFPFTLGVSLEYGTMAHWDNQLPGPPDKISWRPPYFFVSHDFVVGLNPNGDPLFGVYHSSLNCWSFTGLPSPWPGLLMGCLSRNPTAGNTGYGAGGTDFDRHEHRYALRIGTGLKKSESGIPLCEARLYNTPLLASVPRPVYGFSNDGTSVGPPEVEREYSLATISPGSLIVAAKLGSFRPDALILRIYTPNLGKDVEITLGDSPCRYFPGRTIKAVYEVTALEQKVPPRLRFKTEELKVSFPPRSPITTLAIEFNLDVFGAHCPSAEGYCPPGKGACE
jgi:alpha-mannosidase